MNRLLSPLLLGLLAACSPAPFEGDSVVRRDRWCSAVVVDGGATEGAYTALFKVKDAKVTKLKELLVFAGTTEDRVEQFFFRCEFALRFRRDLTDENIAGLHTRPGNNDSFIVEMAESLLGDVWNVPGEFFAAKLCFANLHVELVDMNRRVNIVLAKTLRKNDCVFEVVTFP